MKFRVAWIVLNGMIQSNQNSQKSGVVGFDYFLDNYKPKEVDYEYFRLGPKFILSTPIRFVAIYSLVEDSNWNNVIDFAYYVMGKVLRLRARSIHGSKQECIYSLLCLGFSQKNIPRELFEKDDAETSITHVEKCIDGKKRKREHPTLVENN